MSIDVIVYAILSVVSTQPQPAQLRGPGAGDHMTPSHPPTPGGHSSTPVPGVQCLSSDRLQHPPAAGYPDQKPGVTWVAASPTSLRVHVAPHLSLRGGLLVEVR